MSSLPHPVPSRMSHNIAVLFGHEDDTLGFFAQSDEKVYFSLSRS